MQAGVSTACMYPELTEEVLYNYAVNGISHVEIFFNSDCEIHPAFVANLKEIMNRYDITCISIHPYVCPIEPMMLFSQYERRITDLLDYYEKFFEAGQRLGAEFFVLHGNKKDSDVSPEFYCERYLRLVETAKPYQITVAQENVSYCQAGSLRFLREMNRILGSEAKFVLDVKQAVRAGESPVNLLHMLGSHIAHVHISDNSEKGDCLLLGTGTFRIRSFLEILYNYNPECSVILELYRKNFRNISDLIGNYRMLGRIIAGIEKHAESS
ncbi:MAG: sugar phosphate isomerase/epimerase [Oscillospiraceae bacterium]|nr:sugar phosphate isomerase/epimerase [Oscillospiraceae bacterium]